MKRRFCKSFRNLFSLNLIPQSPVRSREQGGTDESTNFSHLTLANWVIARQHFERDLSNPD
jgi:hypothetical protein